MLLVSTSRDVYVIISSICYSQLFMHSTSHDVDYLYLLYAQAAMQVGTKDLTEWLANGGVSAEEFTKICDDQMVFLSNQSSMRKNLMASRKSFFGSAETGIPQLEELLRKEYPFVQVRHSNI